MSDAPDPQTSQGGGHVPPCWPDGTERPSHRPRDAEEQQEYYRGKQQCHTLKKTLLVNDETCQMCILRAPDDGQANDTSLADLEGSRLPPGSWLDPDRGFQGVVLADVTIIQPKKNPRGGENSHPLRKRRIGGSRPSASGLNRPLAG
jgi:hypothetical protein